MYEIENNVPLDKRTPKQKVAAQAQNLYNKGGITKTSAAKMAIYNDNSKSFAGTDDKSAIQYITRRIY